MNYTNTEIAISITEGRTIRDLFYNDLLEMLLAKGFKKITVFTEAIHVQSFIEAFESEKVQFLPMREVTATQNRTRAYFIRKRLGKISPILAQLWVRWEEKWLYKAPQSYYNYFKTNRPRLLLTTHAHLYQEWELLNAAHSAGVPSVGIVRSWDNIHKGIRSRPQKLTVWNEVNKQELLDFEQYPEKDIVIAGAPQFDQYFKPENILTRRAFFEKKGLDPTRPLIFFASLGYFFVGNDETEWMDRLIEGIDSGEIEGKPQLICRLHPFSKYEHFEKYQQHPEVNLSYCSRYWPSLTWYMTKEDMIEMANMLAHSDVVITPGSTVTLEAAIFNIPTIVPTFHTYQPERMKNYFNTWVLGKHFARIKHQGLVPFAENVENFLPLINQGLQDKSWYQEQRRELVRQYVHFTDGKATERIADLAATYLTTTN